MSNDAAAPVQPRLAKSEARSARRFLRSIVVAAGIGASILFVIVGLSAELQMFGDGSIFSYAVAARAAWAFHWHNISGRLFSYIFAYVPAEAYVSLSGNAKAGIFVYGLLHFSAPLLGLAATWALDRTPGRTVFVYACLATACLDPLVFGFPTEMWMAHAVFWPALALCLGARNTLPGAFAVFAALLALVFTHEGGIVLGAAILFALFLRRGGDAIFMRALGAFFAAMALWTAVKLALPPDDYISGVLSSAAFKFIDVWNLEQPALVVLLASLAGYAIAVFFFRRTDPARAPIYAIALCIAGLFVYWIGFDRSLLADARYQMRTVLLMAIPIFGVLAVVQTMSSEDRRAAPFPPLAQMCAAVEQRVHAPTVCGAIALTLLVHAVETTKFLRAWMHYKAAIGALAADTESDPALGNPLFVSSKRIGSDLNRLAWNSTTPYLSVLAAPGLAPNRLVVDPDAGYFWLSCATAAESERTSTAIPLQARAIIREYSCLHRP